MEKVVVVGGTSGIGEATAAAFARAGAEVLVTGRDAARLGEAVARLQGSGRVEGVRADGGDAAGMHALFARVGPFDHLVLAASGGKGAGRLSELSLDALAEGFRAKLFVQLTALQAALPCLRGSVTFVSAASARAALPGTAGLAAINGALEAAVGPLAAELAPVRVNAVSPGVVDTPWWRGMPPETREGFFAQARASLPVGRVGRPEDVAEAILLLARNGFTTGAVLPVDGGVHLARG